MTSTATQSILTAAITEVVIPEILAVIRAHQNASGGTNPTDAQVIAALGVDANGVIQTGQAWLAQHATTT